MIVTLVKIRLGDGFIVHVLLTYDVMTDLGMLVQLKMAQTSVLSVSVYFAP